MASEAYHRAAEVTRRRQAIRWVHGVRSAIAAGADAFDLQDRFGPDAYLFALDTSEMSAREAVTRRLGDLEPQPEGLANIFAFDGSFAELDAHNEAVRAKDPGSRNQPRHPQGRERRPSCSTRVRGSRRVTRSCSRGGDSGDSSGSDEPGGAGDEHELSAGGAL